MTLDELRDSTATVLSVAQVADVLADLEGKRLDERTIRRACEDGQLESIRAGRRLLIPRIPLLRRLGVEDEHMAEAGPP
jgi:hypothetical protein